MFRFCASSVHDPHFFLARHDCMHSLSGEFQMSWFEVHYFLRIHMGGNICFLLMSTGLCTMFDINMWISGGNVVMDTINKIQHARPLKNGRRACLSVCVRPKRSNLCLISQDLGNAPTSCLAAVAVEKILGRVA